jgi:HSP20 family protein
MALMRWDPFGEALKMQRDMDRIFSRLGTTEGLSASTTAWMPRINVKQAGDDLAVHVELAGIKPEDVDVEVTAGVLTIRGERKAETKTEDEGWVIRESSYGSFERSLALPEGVDPATIKADFHDGMLEIHVPHALEATKPTTTRIAIGAAQEVPAAEPTPLEATPTEASHTEAPVVLPAEPSYGPPEVRTHH